MSNMISDMRLDMLVEVLSAPIVAVISGNRDRQIIGKWRDKMGEYKDIHPYDDESRRLLFALDVLYRMQAMNNGNMEAARLMFVSTETACHQALSIAIRTDDFESVTEVLDSLEGTT